ncbi:MAG: NUDIX domain-containing protein [Candidatus Pacebacteria bacterium]|nr:NUDIX domain-containing protein [Candidatus Paceibacterota bacterium]
MQTSILRGSAAIIERDDGKVLMHLRNRSAWIYPNCWAFFGGGAQPGESASAALRRELLEELGYFSFDHRLFSVAWHRKGKKRILDYTFLVSWHQRNVRLDEGKGKEWFSLEEALSLPTLPPHERGDLTRLQTLRSRHSVVLIAA